MSNDDLNIRAEVMEAEESEVLGRINLSGGVITSIARAGETRTTIGATMPKKNFNQFESWFHEHTKVGSSLTADAA
jgi:hypothetical protein